MKPLSLIPLLAFCWPLTAQQWTWIDTSGTIRSSDDLATVLKQHSLWLESDAGAGTRANLRRAKLPGANLSRTVLRRAVLGLADLSKSHLEETDLSEANLWMAQMASAHLSGTDLSGALLVDTDLRSADLRRSNLSAANLRRANLAGAVLAGADIRFANLAFSVGIAVEQLQKASNWKQAYYDEDMLRELGLPTGHNAQLQKRHRAANPESYRRLFGR